MDEFRRTPVNRLQQPPVRPGGPVQGPTSPIGPPPVAQTALQETPFQPTQPTPFAPQPLTSPAGMTPNPPRKSKKKAVLWSISGVVVAALLFVAGAFIWYNVQLSPVGGSSTDKKLVKIEAGSTPAGIAEQLDKEGVIRNQRVFLWQARLKGVENKLQAGTYRLSPSESTPEIIDHLSKGKVDTFSITFLPGATLKANREMFISAGYGADEVDAALAKTYDSPLFEGKPATADLEGYIYGETYTFTTDTTVEAVLEHVFDHYYGIVQKNGLVAKYAQHNLSLYQGITLASIVQREASAKGDDMAQIAQVFYSRLGIDMPLGSDVTYQYIADKLGVARDTNLDSPYNTRRYAGLPPGPISAPGEKALISVANPAAGDYLYFLSGDDNVTYFAKTLEEHEANAKNHCQEKCQIL